MSEVVGALLVGFAFGWALHKAGLTHYAKIVSVYRLHDMTVMKFMLTALAVGAVLIQLGVDVGLAGAIPVPPTALGANLVGGVVFGVGMATAGYCPGTIVAEAGEARLDAWIAGLSGLFTGAIAFAALHPVLMPRLGRVGALGRVTLPELAGATPWLVVVVFVEAVLLVLLLLSTKKRSPS